SSSTAPAPNAGPTSGPAGPTLAPSGSGSTSTVVPSPSTSTRVTSTLAWAPCASECSPGRPARPRPPTTPSWPLSSACVVSPAAGTSIAPGTPSPPTTPRRFPSAAVGRCDGDGGLGAEGGAVGAFNDIDAEEAGVGELVGRKREVASHRLEVGGLQGGMQGVFVGHIALHLGQGRIDEVGGIVRLGGVHGRHAAIGLGEGFNELLVLGVVEVGGVGGAGNHAHRQRFQGRQGG